MHQMVKITHAEAVSWRERMRYARSTAIEGKEVLKQLQKLIAQLKKEHLRKIKIGE